LTPSGNPVIIRGVLYTALTVGGSETELLWDEWENEDSSVFGETLSAGKLWKVSLLAQGTYSVSANAEWDTNFDAHHGMLVLDDSNATSNAGFSPINAGAYNSRFDADEFTYPPMLGFTRKWPRYGVTPDDVLGGVYGRMLFKVVQRSGSDKTLEAAQFEITYHGATANSI